jgi:hypothetical protein
MAQEIQAFEWDHLITNQVDEPETRERTRIVNLMCRSVSVGLFTPLEEDI